MRIVILLLALFAVLVASPAVAQKEEMDPALMAKMMELGQPSEEHQLLEKLVGSWPAMVKMYMSPEAAPMEAEAQTESEMILGGRFLLQKGTGSMMGQTIESLTIMGYDRRHEVYTLVGFDTSGTYFITAQGTLREDGTLVLEGRDEDPMMGSQEFEFHLRFNGDDEYESTWYMSLAGSEKFKMVEWTSTRN